MPDRVAVTSAEFVRQIGRWQSEALEHPISITHHGRERLVLISSKRYEEARAAATDCVALRRALDQLALLSEVEIDATLRIVRVNEVFLRLTKLKEADVVGKKLGDLTLLADRADIDKRVQRTLKDGADDTFSLRVVRPDAAPTPLTATCARAPDGGVLVVAAPALI